jgi:tRNA A-37 threonylcarbamoyl transferase component Bud32
MAFVEINPKYQDFLRRHGLVSAGQLLRLPAVVISGHADRHVAQVSLGTGPDTVAAFLKREHRVWWKDRVAGAWAGFGLVSRSYREARALQELRRAGLPCPEWIAAGEDEGGRAFLLVRELTGSVDLRLFLERQRSAPLAERFRLARRLGEALARVHAAGFDHPDLYAKHVLVDPDTGDLRFLDWQRSRRRRSVSRRQRWRDLAALHASLADHLARPRERLACLLAYLRAAGQPLDHRNVRRAVRSIRREAAFLLRRRHVREQHQPPLGTGTQNLIWLDGEALSVTREFWSALRGEVPRWLLDGLPPGSEPVAQVRVELPGGGAGLLLRRRAFRPLGRLWNWLGRRTPRSPELRQAGLLFRLQRYGLRTPRLLAVGQRQRAAHLDSFLLLEPLSDTVPLAAWLKTAPAGDRRLLFRECCVMLRRLHEAHCYLADADGGCPLAVQARPGEAPAVVLATVGGIATRRRLGRSLIRRDFTVLRREFAGAAQRGPLAPRAESVSRSETATLIRRAEREP